MKILILAAAILLSCGTSCNVKKTPQLIKLEDDATKGDVVAIRQLAEEYATGSKEVEKNEEEAVRWYKNLAEKTGDTGAMVYVGQSYLIGRGVDKDGEEAVRWFEKSAESKTLDKNKSVEAMAKLGALYSDGKVVPEDRAKAVYWYTKAAKQENKEAMFILGVWAGSKRGDQNAYREALNWYLAAAYEGMPEAMIAVGNIYQYGRGVRPNNAHAVQWFERAAQITHDPELLQKIDRINALVKNEPPPPTPRKERTFDGDGFLKGVAAAIALGILLGDMSGSNKSLDNKPSYEDAGRKGEESLREQRQFYRDIQEWLPRD